MEFFVSAKRLSRRNIRILATMIIIAALIFGAAFGMSVWYFGSVNPSIFLLFAIVLGLILVCWRLSYKSREKELLSMRVVLEDSRITVCSPGREISAGIGDIRHVVYKGPGSQACVVLDERYILLSDALEGLDGLVDELRARGVRVLKSGSLFGR